MELDLETVAPTTTTTRVAFSACGRAYVAVRFTRGAVCQGTELYLVGRDGAETFIRYACGRGEVDRRAIHLTAQADAAALGDHRAELELH